ncbi:unnamed protein product [Dibothriocephalus latus]|uniref:Uncharacterized protein n=1 Tax=Dibothriocephalus latus TaxID=60516 RepID=A0A3P7LL27_DIBLA|nr:unnamed protein product [Dibothriocephalus latus]
MTECKCADFSFAAMDRSPVARMMEGTDYVIGIMAYEQSRESKYEREQPDTPPSEQAFTFGFSRIPFYTPVAIVLFRPESKFLSQMKL